MIEERRVESIPIQHDRRLSFETVLENISNNMKVIILISKGNEILYVNKTFYEKFGYEDTEKPKFSDLFPDDTKEMLLDRSKRRLINNEGLPDYYTDLELKTKMGFPIYLNIYPSVINYDGQICIIYVAVDTTEQMRTRKALTEFFEYCPLPAFIKDRQNRMVKASHFYYQTTQMPELNIIGKTSDELWPKIIADRLKKEDEWVYKNKKPLVVDEEINGRYYVKTKFPINGNLLGGFSVDITDRVEKRRQLEESEKRYKELYDVLASFLNTMTDMVWVYDKNKNIMFSNKALEEFLDDISIFEIQECMSLPENTETFIKVFNIKGIDLSLEITKNPLFDDKGNVVGCSGGVKDVTETLRISNNIIKKIQILENGTLKDTKEAINTLNSTIENLNRGWKTNVRR